MTILVAGKVRVFAHANVGALYALRWNDVDADHPNLAGWRARGLVTDTDPKGAGPPVNLPKRCCGAR